MNSTQQYGYHPYPSPSQTQAQAQTPQQQQVLSPQQQQQVLSPQQQHQQQVLSPQQQQQQLPQNPSDASSQQQQLSPQQSPPSHHHSPELQHASHINNLIDRTNGNNNSTSNNNGNNANGNGANNSNNNTNGNNGSNNSNSNNSMEQQHPHSPSHSNDAQSPIDAEGELIVPGQVTNGQQQQQQAVSGVASSTMHSPTNSSHGGASGTGQSGHPNTLVPMPSPDIDATTAANTAANTNSSASRQMILQQYQQHQQHQNQFNNMAMSMANSTNGTGGGHHPGAINTMMSLQGPSAAYVLPSPQSAGANGQPPLPLPAIPPMSTDLDSILVKYSNQPELLKLIIESKKEEDRRWAEEARYRMMDLIMRGENRSLNNIPGYEGLGGMAGQMPGAMMSMTVKRFVEEGGYGHPSMFGGFTPSGPMGTAPGTVPVGTPQSTGPHDGGPGGAATGNTTGAGGSALNGMNSSSSAAMTGSTTSGIPTMYAQSQMPNPFGMGSMGGMSGITHGPQSMMSQTMSGNAPGFGQNIDASLARKRSVTFAGEVHHHMRSQSLSAMPTTSSMGTLGGMPVLGGMNSTDAFGQQQQFQQQQQQQQQQHHSQAMGFQSVHPYPFGQPQQSQMNFQHHAAASVHPFGGGNPYGHQTFVPQQHALGTGVGVGADTGGTGSSTGIHPNGNIRRTNSLSHISQTQTTITEQRLSAGRPRNESSASIRTMDNNDDSDDESDDDYDNHPLIGMASRPGSALSIHNNIGGNNETALAVDFSDMASVSGGSGGHHHHNGHHANDTSSGNNKSSSTTTTTTTTIKTHRSTSSTSSLAGIIGGGSNAGSDYKRKRKRREMQPVNKIVDSLEPHVDPYLWKNNGNTTQKKTGCKSIYYKCSNSTAGCTVNKTVTEKEGGGFVTKYRGEHLEDCIKLKKAQLAAQAAQVAQAAAQNGHHSFKKEQ
ncbi:hypothetical protein BX616_000378 [Lobosporangium transversale]|nr:hypothetical protein BX616_000378 [Lobosporangium transversale]